jgi:hypothetical protein
MEIFLWQTLPTMSTEVIAQIRRLNDVKADFDAMKLVSEAHYYNEHPDEWRDLKYLLERTYSEHPVFVIAFKRLEQIEQLLPEQIRVEIVDCANLNLDILIEELLDEKILDSDEIRTWAEYYLLSTQTLPVFQPVEGSPKQINVEKIMEMRQNIQRSKWVSNPYSYGKQMITNYTSDQLTGRITVDLYPHPPPPPNKSDY